MINLLFFFLKKYLFYYVKNISVIRFCLSHLILFDRYLKLAIERQVCEKKNDPRGRLSTQYKDYKLE